MINFKEEQLKCKSSSYNDNLTINNGIINDEEQLKCKSFSSNDNSTVNNGIINDEEPLDKELLMISNIWNNSNTNNKDSLIRDVLDKSIINDIMDDESLDDDFKELLINDTFKHSMTCKILQKPINKKGSLIKEPAINNILSHPMNNNLKKYLVNEKYNQSAINNILKQSTINDKKLEINNTLEKTIICNILKGPVINNKRSLITNLKDSKINKDSRIINKKLEETTINTSNEMINNLEEPKINNISVEQMKKLKQLGERFVNFEKQKKSKYKKNNKKSLSINDSEEEEIMNDKKSDYVKTPEFLVKRKLIINPLTKDNKSFLDSVTLSVHHKVIGKNNTRQNKIRKYSDTFNWKNINFPPTNEDYEQFEKDTEDIKLNILEIKHNEEIDYVYESKLDDRKNKVNLLLLEKKHYIFVKNLFSILNYLSSESESESKS